MSGQGEIIIGFTLLLIMYLIIDVTAVRENYVSYDNKSVNQFQTTSLLSCDKQTDFAWCLPKDYNEKIAPWNFRKLINSTLPWFYYFDFQIFDIQAVDDQAQTVTLEMFFIIKWYEPRIEVNHTSEEWEEQAVKIDGDYYISIPISEMSAFWIPDMEIYRLKRYIPQEVLKPTASLRTSRNKLMRYVARIEMVISCQMDFENYPFDSHNCTSQQGSFYNTQDVVDCTATFYHDSRKQRNLQYAVEVIPLPPERHTSEIYGAKWATCGFQMMFTRKKIQIFCQVYLTSTLLVFVSSVSFLINPIVVPGRVGLLVTVFLVLINIFISVKRDSPTSSGFLNAIDIFLVVCVGYVFFAILEYAIVLFGNRTRKENTIKIDPKLSASMDPDALTSPNLKPYISEEGVKTLDHKSLILYPISFITFIVCYLCIYVIK